MEQQFSKEEVLALRAYFDNISVNLTSFAKKHGRDTTTHLNKAIDKIYKND
jgi:hypothetical protein